MADLESGLAIIAADPARAHFAGPRDPDLVASKERVLGGALPPTYRAFVKRLGAGNFDAFEVFGVIDEDHENSSVPDGIWLTLDERRKGNLPHDLVIIGDTGDGDYYCLRLQAGESPVFICGLGDRPAAQDRETVASDFGEFFLERVKAQL